MSSGDLSGGSLQKAQVLAHIDPLIKRQVDLSFLPSGTRFVTDVPKPDSIPMPCRLVIASGNSQLVAEVTTAWLQNQQTTVEILWNYRKDPDFAYALLKLAKDSPYSNFRKINSTAHLVLSSNTQLASTLPPTDLTPDVITLLEETVNENASVPPEVLKQLLWRHAYLLEQISSLSNKIDGLTQQLSQARTANDAAKTATAKFESEKAVSKELETKNANLLQEVLDLKRSLSSLQNQYDALSSSKLGSLTLKYWERRRK